MVRALGALSTTYALPAEQRRDADNRCSICLEGYAADGWVRALRCGHRFHQACVDRALGTNASCPLCRFPLLVYAEDDDNVEEAIAFYDGPESVV